MGNAPRAAAAYLRGPSVDFELRLVHFDRELLDRRVDCWVEQQKQGRLVDGVVPRLRLTKLLVNADVVLVEIRTSRVPAHDLEGGEHFLVCRRSRGRWWGVSKECERAARLECGACTKARSRTLVSLVTQILQVKHHVAVGANLVRHFEAVVQLDFAASLKM